MLAFGSGQGTRNHHGEMESRVSETTQIMTMIGF